MQRAIAAPMFPRPINAAFIFAPCSRRESHIYDLPTPKNSIDDNSHSYLPMRPTTFCSQLASYILGDFAQCPLYPQKRTLHCTAANVRFVPKADIRRCSRDWRYSITSSAVASRDGGTVRPSVLAVLRLTKSANFVGSWTGSSAGLAPFRIRST